MIWCVVGIGVNVSVWWVEIKVEISSVAAVVVCMKKKKGG